MAHAERVAGDSAAQAEWDAAAKKRKPGRPSKLASGISSRGLALSWGGNTPSGKSTS